MTSIMISKTHCRSRWLYICRCYDYLLREGLEVLLVIMTLTTMTRKVKDNKGTASVIGGSILGLILSITLAVVFIQTLGNNGLLREGMEATLGIIAVVLMYIVGIWMHRRSSAKRWNDMIQKYISKCD